MRQELFYEGSGSNAELVLSLILAATLVYIPITIAIVGKRLWIKYRSAAVSNQAVRLCAALRTCECQLKHAVCAHPLPCVHCVALLNQGAQWRLGTSDDFQGTYQRLRMLSLAHIAVVHKCSSC